MKKTVMVDMDEVITEGGFLHLINEFAGTNYTKDDVKGYYMQDLISDKDAFFKYYITKNQYDYGILIPDVVEVLNILKDYYDIYICSSYIIKEIPKECGILLLYKHNYLCEKLPFIPVNNYAFVNNKSIINCDIKIDDKIDNLVNADIKILFTSYHNKDLDDKFLKENGIIRANNWLEVKNILLKELDNESNSTKK
ncbi:MAG: 5' nucleotidase, NT5C type [Bacilli bacterium]